MEPRHYYAIVEGYQNKQKKKAELLRQSVWASLANWEGSISYRDFCFRFFPLWFDQIDERKVDPPSPEKIQEMFKMHEKAHEKYKKKKKK